MNQVSKPRTAMVTPGERQLAEPPLGHNRVSVTHSEIFLSHQHFFFSFFRFQSQGRLCYFWPRSLSACNSLPCFSLSLN